MRSMARSRLLFCNKVLVIQTDMSKGSGGTRATSWRNKTISSLAGGVNDDFFAVPTQSILDFDQLTRAEREQILEKAKFTGMVDEEGFFEQNYATSVYKQQSKKDLFNIIDDETWNNDIDADTSHYIVKYDGQPPLYVQDLTERTKLKRTNVEWVSANGGVSNYRYWFRDDIAKKKMMEYMGFVEYKNGKRV